jgi:hypothetical protein
LLRDWYVPQYVPDNGCKNTEIKQKEVEKIFSEYPLQYMEIRVGHLGIVDFTKANQFYRVLNATGFLDAINYITNHEVENNSLFKQDLFYETFVNNFIAIYKATLIISGNDYEQDNLLTQILSDKLGFRSQYYLIRDSLEIELTFPSYLFLNNVDYALDSPQAFALTRAYEYACNLIDSDVLL